MNSKRTSTDAQVKPKGETLVWLSSAGLAIGIIMIVFLLGLIFVKGFSVFWPKEIVEITLKENSRYQLGQAPEIAGAIIKKQWNETDEKSEWQLFIGNRENYGAAFKYISEADIEATKIPESIMVAERLEYGKAIFYPISLRTETGKTIDFSNPEFTHFLFNALENVQDRRDTIHFIEKKEIGKINRSVEKLRLEKRALERDLSNENSTHTEKLNKINTELDTLNSKYEILAKEARQLRELQRSASLEYQLPSGELKTQVMGEFVDFYQPNSMGFLSKIGFFFHQLWKFLSENPREANTEGGIFPAIFGTFVMTVLMSAAVVPFGVIAAIYLKEYAKQGMFVRGVRIAINNLAGVPSIVFGVFGLGFFVYFVGGSIDSLFFSDKLPTATFGTGGILWASLTLALMTVPVVIVATEEALSSVPRGMREASLACGASKWQTIQKIILPASAPGILTGLILAMARGAGEVAPLMMVGVVKLAPSLPVDGIFPFFHLERKFMHLGFHIYDLGFQSPDSEAARPMVFATTFLLIVLVVVLNLGAIIIRSHLQKKYKTSTF